MPDMATAPTPKARVSNILPVTQQGERTLRVIKRHPIGIYGVYVMCGLALLMTAVLAFGVVPGITSSSSAMLVGVIVFLVVLVVCVTSSLIAGKVYWGNTWTLTTDSITQVNQVSLFTRQSSQLSLNDLEDVTSEQNGILAEMFNFGLLRVETAGERSKFMFPYCPNPNYYAQQILGAREAFEQSRRLEESSAYAAPPPAAAPAAAPVQPVWPAQAFAQPAAAPAAVAPVAAAPSPDPFSPPQNSVQPPVSVAPIEASLTEDQAVAEAFKLSPTDTPQASPLPPAPTATPPAMPPTAVSDTPQAPPRPDTP